MSTEWRGEELIRKMGMASMNGVNRTMAEAVTHAKKNHEWNNQTGTLEGSTQIHQYAKPEGTEFVGRWGSADVVYARRMEFGFSGMDSSGRSVNQPARPYLRPAADKIYGKLADNIKKELEKLP